MKRIVPTVALLLVSMTVPATAQEPAMLPCGVPYECAVDIRVANATATWKMTFDRRSPGIYDIVHWEIAYTDGRRAEYLAQLMRPEGERMHYRFFIRERRGVWWTLGIRKRLVWRQVIRGTPEQNTMVARVQLLYSVSHYLRRGLDPRSLQF